MIIVYSVEPTETYYIRKEGNVLFNDALNTFYGVIHMVKDHSDIERGNLLPPHGLLFPINSKGSFICIIPQTRQDNTYHSLCYTSRGALAGMRNSSTYYIKPRSNNINGHGKISNIF